MTSPQKSPGKLGSYVKSMANALKDWESRIGRRFKLRDLHILSVVVQWGSMAKAATHLSMT